MTGFNLPPGCNDSDIPGNRPEDIAWEAFHERIDECTANVGLDPDEAELVWQMGLSAYSHACGHFASKLRDMRTEDE